MTKSDDQGPNPWRAAGLMGAMGLDLAVCMLIGYWLGSFASKRYGGSELWVVGGLLIGLAVGILSIVILLKKILEDTNG